MKTKITYFINCGETVSVEEGYLFIDNLNQRYGASYHFRKWIITELTSGLRVNLFCIKKYNDILPFIYSHEQAVNKFLQSHKEVINKFSKLIKEYESKGNKASPKE